jgi:deoxyribodipyrimidine photolyase
MCSPISWQQFIITIVVGIVLYYGYVVISYYRKDWWFRLRRAKSPNEQPPSAEAPVAAANASSTPNPLLPVVHDLVDEIRALLQAEGNTTAKDELLDKLQRLLQKYPALKDTPFQPSISQLIYIESKNRCALDLDEDEVAGLWG